MIRIKPRRCGYGGEKGYTCQRLPQLQDWMFNEEIPFIAQMQAEFNKLPLRVKGMVYTEETIDMGWSEFGPHPEVPELTCRSNTDPASDMTDVSVWGATGIPVEVGNATAYPVYGGSSGWLDLFNSGYEITGGTQYFYHNVSGTAAATSDVYIKVTGVDHEYHDIYLVGNIPTFKNGEQEMEMGPGLLEPMLDTDFAPVGIDTIPAWEAGLDADIFTNIVLNAWKGVIDDRIQNIYARLNTLPAYDTDQKLRDLTAAENKDSECDNFQISLESGSPVRDPDDVDAGKYHAATLPNADNTSTPITVGSKWHSRTVTAVWQDAENIWWWTVEDDPNQYTISGGDIAYGDNTISVVGLSGLYAPFYAYLMPSFDVTITHTDVVAADVPTVVDGGTARMITDGDVLPSGGTVTGFTSSGSGTATRYAWETVGDNTAEIRTKTGSQLSEEGTADPEPGGIGIGGVRIIQSAAESDPLILYKIYHEDCIAGIEKPEAAADAATAGWLRLSPVFPYEEELMNVEIPSGTEGVDPTVIGATAGIVQPVHNIQIHGSTEYRTQSPVDVPTVEAVYNFIHNYDDFADGEFEQASALATGSTMYTDGSSVAIYTKEVSGYTGSLAVPGTAIVATDIKTILVEGRTVTASGCVPTAQAVVDYIGELTFDGVGSTVGIIGYTTNVPETLWPIPGSTVDPAAGYVQNVRNIYVAGTHSVSGYAVPTVDAVYNFIHNIAVEGMTFSSALVTGGTLAEITTTAEDVTTVTGYTATGEPGTCYMATAIPVGSTVSIGLDNCAPTVQAVIDYVVAMDVDAVAGTLINGSTTEEWAIGPSYTDPVRGTVEVSSQIVVGATPGLSLQTVPSVKSVYDFVHNDSTDDAYRALATGGTVSNAFGPTYMATKTPPNAPSYRKWNKNSTDQNIAGTAASVTGWTPGTINVIDTIVYVRADMFIIEGSGSITVPSVMAVYDFVHNAYALAEPGTVKVMSGTTTRYVAHGTPGTVYSVDTIDVDIYNAGAYNPGSAAGYTNNGGYWYEEVPTVRAVIQYVEGRACPSAVNGIIFISAGTESLASVQGTTAAAGIVQPVKNIDIGTQDPNAVSPTAVPTVEAVYNFIHGNTITGYDVADAKADIVGSTITASGTAAALVATAKPGTFFVTDDFTVMGGTVTAYNDPQAVPTVLAVYNYIKEKVVSMTGATVGILATTSGSPYEYIQDIAGSTHATGAIQPVVNILVNGNTAQRPESHNDVPTVEAVWNFIHGYTISGTEQSTALATIGTITGTTTGSDPTITGTTFTGGVPGTFDVTGTIVATADKHSVTNVVPTAEAVVRYIASLPEVAINDAVPGTITVKNSQETWWIETVTGGTVDHTAVRGIVDETDVVIVAGTHGLSSVTVPTTEAVYNFIHDIAVTGKTPSSAYAVVAGTTTTTVGGSTAAIVTTAVPGTFLVTDDIRVLGTTVTAWKGKEAVPTALAVAEYVRQYIVSGATVGILTVTDNGETIGDITGSTHASGTVQTVTNIIMNATEAKRAESKHVVPTVEAVIDYIRGTTVTGASVASSLAVAGSITQTPATGEPTDVAFSGGQQGVVNVTSNIIAVNGETSCTDCVPTADAVVKYVSLHGGTSGDGVLPNYQGLQATGGPGPNGIGITFLLPVKPNESTWFTVGSGMSYDAVFATEEDTAGTAVTAGDAVSSSVAGYIRLSIIDPGQNQTAGCVRLYTPTASSGVPLYKSNGFALPASGNSVITISSDAETVSGEPGRVYISNGVNFGGDRAYSKITAPSVEAVYDFIHGTTASGVEMLSALADIAGSTITGTTALALVEDTKPGTVYVTNDFTLYGSTVTTYNDPQAVPTVKAVVDYIRLYGGSTDLAVVGSFTATASAETWVDGSTASEGIFKVVKDVKMATTDSDAARSISRTSVPTVEAVYLFVSDYTATVGSFTATSSAETWVSGSTAIAGITKVVSNIAMASTDTAAARSISKTAVPTVEAVKKYVDDHVYTGPFAVEATGTGTNVKIKEGKAYFGTTVFTYAGIASTAMANSATLYAKCTKGSSTITIVTTDTTGSTVACFPIASKDASGNITQRQWGDINIMGRWM